VYVPLRGVFERLGASVVYQNGIINATRGSTTIELHIGSTTATVNGMSEGLDSPPFLVGDRTLVPLRFVSQALGATVAFIQSSDTVAITTPEMRMPGIVRRAPMIPAGRPALDDAAAIVRPEPLPGSTVTTSRPQISATFRVAVDPNTVHLTLDGRDITSAAYISDRSVSFDTPSDVPNGSHDVVLDARSAAEHERLHADWNFTLAPAASPNRLDELVPRNGARVDPHFVVEGRTLPGSRVAFIATSLARQPFSETTESTARTTVTAGPDGYFTAPLFVSQYGAGIVDVRIESRSLDGAVIVKTLRLRSAQQQ
jgi:hypothetical protein